MSAQNGDKARYGRLRKKKITRRILIRGLRKSLSTEKVQAARSTVAKTAAPKKASVEKMALANVAKNNVPVKKPAKVPKAR
jgi:hypothetical protein